MQDFLGNELHIGDTIVYMQTGLLHDRMVKATITGFTKHCIKTEDGKKLPHLVVKPMVPENKTAQNPEPKLVIQPNDPYAEQKILIHRLADITKHEKFKFTVEEILEKLPDDTLCNIHYHWHADHATRKITKKDALEKLEHIERIARVEHIRYDENYNGDTNRTPICLMEIPLVENNRIII